MLGKVFEELVNERHESGAYYTPRPVVSFMCRESLKGFLSGQTGASAATGLTDATIADFVDARDTDGVSVADARKIAAALERVTVVDPACGSGAYLLGMMQELVDLQTTLFNAGVDSKAIYDLKLEIIRRNLYGADIDDFAVNIAMLRLWLSLAIDYEGNDPPPLPNLDFKIACGDSLLAPDPSPQNYGDLFGDFIRQFDLGSLISKHMRATEQPEKDRLKARIEHARQQIREMLGDAAGKDIIDWRVEFAEVMSDGGFDIVVANPPYVQLQRDGGRLANLYKNAGYSTFIRTGDIYQLFFERGCQMLKPSAGLMAYITSNSWLKAEYGKRTRRYLSEKHTPLQLIELGKDVFESAIVDSCVLLTRTGRTDDASSVIGAVDMDRVGGDFLPAPDLWGQARSDGDAPWSILSNAEQEILDKMLAKGTPLKEWDVAINMGIKTGYNKAFIIDTTTKDTLVAADAKSAEIIKPVLRGRDIQRYQAQWAGLWLVDTHNGYGDIPAIEIDDYPAVKSYLDDFSTRLKRRGDKGKTHYNLRNCAYHENFKKEKLLWLELVESGRFAYDDSGIYGEATTFMLTGEHIKYLCAVLNSTLIRWFLQQIAPTSGMGTLRWKKAYVETIPIPKIDAEAQRPFIALVDKILKAKTSDPQADTSELEEEIDWLVYDLYDLTEQERAAIRQP